MLTRIQPRLRLTRNSTPHFVPTSFCPGLLYALRIDLGSSSFTLAMSPNPQINYQPLSPSSPQIRTLILHPGKPTDPIQCSLHVISLADSLSYEALSYTWGDVSITRPIEVDGTQFKATVNLERALRHLRDVSSDLTLWVDAGTYPTTSDMGRMRM